MHDQLKIKMYSLTLDCIDPYELATFYAALLNWEIVFSDEEYVCLGAPGARQGAYPGITCQRNPLYKLPVWPAKAQAQQQMAHMDFAVNDLDKAIGYAIECGAKIAEHQFSKDWKVMIDPSGHPFCLCQMKSVIESDYFALL